jgi:hypothetical protein
MEDGIPHGVPMGAIIRKDGVDDLIIPGRKLGIEKVILVLILAVNNNILVRLLI